jgi:parallel beta-helix repeat protein
MLFRVAILAGVFLLSSALVWIVAATKSCTYAGQGTNSAAIQAAINTAKPGATLILIPGTYRENLVITKPILLLASGYASTIVFPGARDEGILGNCIVLYSSSSPLGTPPVVIDAADQERPAIEIRAEGVEVRGLVIRGGSHGILVSQTRKAALIDNRISHSSQAGIALLHTHDSTLQGNHITQSESGTLLEGSHKNRLLSQQLQENQRGLVLRSSHENEIRSNRALANSGEGILLESSDRNELADNQSERNAWGLVILTSSGNTLHGNRLERNARSLRVWGDTLAQFVHQVDRSNTIDGKAVYYLIAQKDITLRSQDQPGYVALIQCERITIDGISLGRGAEGILLVDTHHSTVRNSVLLATMRGIYLRNSRENEISQNRIEQTETHGITLLQSPGNRLLRNRVMGNGGHGVFLEDSQENQLQENQIEGNRESGVHLKVSRKVTLEQNQIRGNWVGVFVEQGGAHVIQENWIRESQFGIFVYQSSDNRFADNRLEHNRHDTNATEQPPPPSPKPPPPSTGGS